MRPKRGRKRPLGRIVASAANGDRDHGQADASCDGECTSVKFADARPLDERPFGKKHQRLSGVRRLDERRASMPPAWRLNRSTNSEPMRRNSSPASGTLRDFFLDDEAEARRQDCLQHDAVDVARVVGDDDARRQSGS